MRTALLLLVAFTACAVRTSNHATDASCGHADGGTPYTPGTVSCGSTGACPAGGMCVACNATSGTPGLVCGAQPGDTCNFALACDGPEDCKPGERCYAFESAICATSTPGTGFYVVCHTDADCDCGERCDGGQCR